MYKYIRIGSNSFKYKKREVSKHHYYLIDYKGNSWSLVNIKSLMNTMPLVTKELKQMYKYWEAMLIGSGGVLQTDVMLRESSLRGICHMITEYYETKKI